MSIEQSHTNTEQSSDASNHMKKCQRSLQRGGIKGWQMISLTIGRDYWDCALILASSSGSASLLLQPLVIDTNISLRKFFYFNHRCYNYFPILKLIESRTISTLF